MNMPGFTAGASLYRTNRHYRTGRNRQAIHLPAPTIETIHPAREVIEVHSCPPGWTDYGGTCVPGSLNGAIGGRRWWPWAWTGRGRRGGVPGAQEEERTRTPHQKPPKVPSTQRPPRPQEGMACNAFIRSKKGDSYDIPEGRYTAKAHQRRRIGTVATAIGASVAGKRVNGTQQHYQAEIGGTPVLMEI